MANRPSPAAYGSPMNPADLLQQIQNNPEALSMLQRFGLSMPEHIRQNFLLPEPGTPGFFGQHPRVSKGIENAFLGLASMGPPGATTGENISNVARSVFAVPEMREQHQLQQVMAPFQTAQMLSGMDKSASETEKNQAEATLARAHAGYYTMGGTGKNKYSHYVPTNQGVYGVTKEGSSELLKDEVTGNTLFPPASANDHMGWEQEMQLRAHGMHPAQADLSAPDRARSMKQYAELWTEYTAGKAAMGAAGRAGGTPGWVSPTEEQDYRTKATLYVHKRNDLSRQLNEAMSVGGMPGDKEVDDVQQQLDALDEDFIGEAPTGKPAPNNNAPSPLGSFLNKYK